jgi:hypothetical protein
LVKRERVIALIERGQARGQAGGQVKCALAQLRPRSYVMCRKVIEAERKVGDQETRARIEHVSRQRGGDQERRARNEAERRACIEMSTYGGRRMRRYEGREG